jgi:phosphatidylserine decarboxylase
MTVRATLARITQQENLNFLLTNRIPRRLATRFMGWFSAIRNPWVARASIAAWKAFAELDLADARKARFDSLHDCFVRELRPGARTIDQDPAVLASPCDAIVGAAGAIVRDQLVQAKGFPYALHDLLQSGDLARRYVDGCYATLRLTSGMYHRFHAPHACRVRGLTYISGDTWNVNPIALKRVEKLFCKNERALITVELATSGHMIALVPVAAILVAGIRLHFADIPRHVRAAGTHEIACEASFAKGQEMGWFEHGSTIIVFAPKGFTLCPNLLPGTRIRMGQALMRLPAV